MIAVTKRLSLGTLTLLTAAFLVACGSDNYGGSADDEIANRPPVASDMELSTTPNGVVSGILAASDADGDALTFTLLISIPDVNDGTIELTDPATGTFTYTPGPNQSTVDSYDFVANDGEVDSNIASLTVTVIAPATGVWSGDLISDASQQSTPVTAIIGHDNDARIIANSGVQYVGSLDVSGDLVTSALTGYAAPGLSFPDGSSVAVFTIDGTLQVGDTLSGSYSGAGDSGTFSFAYESAISETTSSLDSLSATWTTTDLTGYTLTINVASDGLISGSDTDGCTYNGNANVFTPSINIFDLDVTVASCGDRDGSYVGLATVVDSTDLPQVRCLSCDGLLILGVSNADYSVTGALEK